MTFKTAFFLLFFVFSFVTSCRSTRQVVQKSDTVRETQTKDVVSYKDTILYAPASKTELKLPMALLQFKPYLNGDAPSLKPQKFSQKNGNATVTVDIKGDAIHVTANCDSLAMAAKIKHYYKTELNKIETEFNALEKTTRGVSVFKTILFSLSAFIIGMGAGVLIKTLKLI